MTNEWRVLDFDFPEELPFDILSEHFGEEAAIYITHVGNHSEAKEEAFGYLEGVVMKMPVNQCTINSLKSFHEQVRGKGVYIRCTRLFSQCRNRRRDTEFSCRLSAMGQRETSAYVSIATTVIA